MTFLNHTPCSSGFIQDKCQILIDYFSFSFYSIDFKPWHNDTQVLKFSAMTVQEFTVALSDVFRMFWITMWINVGSNMYMSGEAS